MYMYMYLQTWEKLYTVSAHGGAISSLEIIGQVLISASFDQTVRCYDLKVS